MADLPQNFSRTISGQEMGFTKRTQILEQVPSNQQQTVQPANLEQQVIKQLYDTVFKESAPSDLSKLHEIYADKIQNAINNIQREADLRKAITDATRKEIEARNQSIKLLQETTRQQRRSQMGTFGKTKDSIEHILGKFDSSKLGDITKKVTGNDKLMSVYSSFSKGDLKGVLDNTRSLIGVGTKLAQVGSGVLLAAKLVVDAFENYASLSKRSIETSSVEAFLSKGSAYRSEEQRRSEQRGIEAARKYTGDTDSYDVVRSNLSKQLSKTYLDELNRGSQGFTTKDLTEQLLAVGKGAELRGGNAEQAQNLMLDIQRRSGLDSSMSASSVDKFYKNIEKKFDKLPTGKVATELINLYDATKQYGVGLDSILNTTSKFDKELTSGILSFQDFGTANKAQEGSSIEDLFKQVSILSQSGMLSDIGSKLGKEYENLSVDQLVAKILTDPKVNQYILDKKATWVDKNTPSGAGSIVGKSKLSDVMNLGLTNKNTAVAFEKGSIKDSGAILAAGQDASAGKDLVGDARKEALSKLNQSMANTATVVSKTVGPIQDFANEIKETTRKLKNFSGVLAGSLEENSTAQAAWQVGKQVLYPVFNPTGFVLNLLK